MTRPATLADLLALLLLAAAPAAWARPTGQAAAVASRGIGLPRDDWEAVHGPGEVGQSLVDLDEQIGTRSSFLTRITRDIEQSEVLAAFNAPNGCDIVPGSVLALPQTF